MTLPASSPWPVMLPQSAPKGGDLERMDLEGGDVQGRQMRHPGRLVGEMMRP